MSGNFLIRSQSFSDNHKNINKAKVHFTKKIIDLFENYISTLSENEKENRQTLIENIDKFIEHLKTDYINLFRQLSKDTLNDRKDFNYDSLLSIVDIKIDLEDNCLLKQLKGFNLNENQFPDFLIKNIKEHERRSMKSMMGTGTNTEVVPQCEISIQTIKTNVDYKSYHDLYFLRGQIKEIQTLINAFLKKKNDLISITNIAYEKLQNLYLLYNSHDDPRTKIYVHEETETCRSWIQQRDYFLERSSRLCAINEELQGIVLKNADLERTCNDQMQEIQTKFELVESMSCKYAELIQSNDNLNLELLEMKEINEFQESENQSLSITRDKLYEEFNEYVKVNNKKMRELRSYNDAPRKRNIEKRAYNYKFEETKTNLVMNKAELDCYSDQLLDTLDSVRNYPLCGDLNDNIIINLRKKLTTLEDSWTIGVEDRNRWEEEEACLSCDVNDNYYLMKNIVTLTNECDTLESDLAATRAQESVFHKCFSELKMATSDFGNKNKSSNLNEIDMCRDILSKYNF